MAGPLIQLCNKRLSGRGRIGWPSTISLLVIGFPYSALLLESSAFKVAPSRPKPANAPLSLLRREKNTECVCSRASFHSPSAYVDYSRVIIDFLDVIQPRRTSTRALSHRPRMKYAAAAQSTPVIPASQL